MPSSFITPWTVAHQAPLSMRFPWQDYWSGLPFSSPGDLPTQGSNPCLLLGRQILYHWATWEALSVLIGLLSINRNQVVLLSLSLHSFPSNPWSLCLLFFCTLLKRNKEQQAEKKKTRHAFLSLAFFTKQSSFLVLVFLIMFLISGFLWKFLEIDVL